MRRRDELAWAKVVIGEEQGRVAECLDLAGEIAPLAARLAAVGLDGEAEGLDIPWERAHFGAFLAQRKN